MPVREHEHNGHDYHVDNLLRTLRRPSNGASSMARRPNEIKSARTTTQYGAEPTRFQQPRSYSDRSNYYTGRSRRFHPGFSRSSISSVNALPLTGKRLNDIGTQTMPMEATIVPQLTRPPQNQHYQVNAHRPTDNANWRTRNIFDLPDSDVEDNRTPQAPMRAIPQPQRKEIEPQLTMLTNARNPAPVALDCKCTKRHRLPFDELSFTKLKLSSPRSLIMPARNVDNGLVIGPEQDIIYISSDEDSGSSSRMGRGRDRRKRLCTSNLNTQPNATKLVNTHEERLQQLQTPEIVHSKLPVPVFKSSELETGRISPLHEPSLEETGNSLIQESFTRADTPEPSSQKNTTEALINALTEQMRTPTSSMFDEYMHGDQDETIMDHRIVDISMVTKEIKELAASASIRLPQRRVSHTQLAHRIMPDGYYEAISQHVRRPQAQSEQSLPSAGGDLNAESSGTANNEMENSDQDESESAGLQDFQLSDDTALELTIASSAVQRVIRRFQELCTELSQTPKVKLSDKVTSSIAALRAGFGFLRALLGNQAKSHGLSEGSQWESQRRGPLVGIITYEKRIGKGQVGDV
ncbi:hypothetical protein MMC11_000960 [Xylographa trunciseda]|nr:hypothetical protein [Xylographa trunciseda]